MSGCWRAQPPGRQWIAGYWREQGSDWQWVPGFWAVTEEKSGKVPEMTYCPEPPAPPNTAAPGAAPDADSFYVPGNWVWRDGRYVWAGGYWARVQPNFVWVPAHYRWTPYGYVFVPGYWDHALAHRGILYAPVIVDPAVVGPTFVYTPRYAVADVVIVDSLWVRPRCCHYYFGDYYGPVYRRYGYESCIVYSQRHYDSIIVYRTWECRHEPRWHESQVNIYLAREHGRAPLPPRTLAQQNAVLHQHTTNVTNVNVTQVNNITVLAPASKVAAAQGIKTVAVNQETRAQAKTAAQQVQTASVQQRLKVESGKIAGPPRVPHTVALPIADTHSHLPGPATQTQPGAKSGTMVGLPTTVKGPVTPNMAVPKTVTTLGKVPPSGAAPIQPASATVPAAPHPVGVPAPPGPPTPVGARPATPPNAAQRQPQPNQRPPQQQQQRPPQNQQRPGDPQRPPG